MRGLRLVKKSGGIFQVAYESDEKRAQHLKNGTLCFADIHQPRNPDNISRYQMLMRLGFEHWEPQVEKWEGVEPEKFFPKFKEQVLILAGWYETIGKRDGSVAVVAKSVSFDELDDEEMFQMIYDSVFNVIWKFILLKNQYKTKDEVENIIAQMRGYE